MKRSVHPVWSALAAMILGIAPRAGASEQFERFVRPLIAERCRPCHGPDRAEGSLRLDSRGALLTGGSTGAAVTPGDPGRSLLVRVLGGDAAAGGPHRGLLTPGEIGAIEVWIAAGAPWPGARVASGPAGKALDWWAFQPLRRPPVPGNPPGAESPIDTFIDDALRRAGVEAAPPASRRVLIRRVSFDLVGLPPSADAVEAFERDPSPDAYERVVDRLLSSPEHGRRWARHWLDVVRYADYHDGNPASRNPLCEPLEAWRYRDWVVDSLNHDLPFDRFIEHHIAGDLLPSPDGRVPHADGLVATTFLVNGAWDRGDADKEKMVSDMVDDQIDTIGKAFLGLTLGCARCHDHKFDPVTLHDYYSLAGIFYSTRMLKELGTKGGEITLQRRPLVPQEMVDRRDRRLAEIASLEALLKGVQGKSPVVPTNDPARGILVETIERLRRELPPEPPMALAVSEGGVPGGLFPGIQDVPIHLRGSYARLGPVVPRGLPRFLAGTNAVTVTEGSGRRELAAWIASPSNPLTARVIVNRVWQWHFGSGLVRTPNNLGLLSEPPSHPELLDWLASVFLEDGGSLRNLHRRIVLSKAYRRSGKVGNETRDRDPENRLMGRFPQRRLEAEALRDALLAASGGLDLRAGGPATHELGSPRRSLYLQTARWDRANFATLFDAANPDASVETRTVSTVAPQVLFLMNHAFMSEVAGRMAVEAARGAPEGGTARIRWLFRRALSRDPTRAEADIASRLLADAREAGGGDPWPVLAHVLLVGNEFVTVD